MKADKMRQAFRQAVFQKQQALAMIVAPDSLSARVAESVGFKAIFAAGYATSASNLGLPDRGIADFGIMLNKCREIVNAVNIPVFADADTGYGNLTNVRRTVRSYEAIGACGLFLEDQKWPKRCGHMAGKSVEAPEVLAEKIATAVAAREHDDFLIMSRTDARQVYDLDEAIRRSKLYHEAGADMVFIEAPKSIAELQQIAAAFPDVPLMANMIEDGATPSLPTQVLGQMGFSIVVHPTALTYAQTFIDEKVLKNLKATGTTDAAKAHMVTFDKFNQFIGLDKVNAVEARYTPEKIAALIGK
ncbi:carboxyvinyl-carboxyphosphonate phosphorylmutase [Agrilactobacillus composti DSM 18527 = JCM 14202]|uniref:Carboxyvinyl-carboxyphosphonate phosphorylmutase n=1 Tax=Agrilactobacillus composti DSM 18527 = JCM 14202 TaxID=1423734 RepID=A0A0R1Y4P4_9LACO|nr:isocitrate lyase/PEP mutase family protein [Agrilactobacillus composti]KRM35049.1 carboxyvinyl-carboxyphosphonate phosphorylmutase [Agrilactobacillus composti DSM 18527 = JCM 14202]